MADKVQFYFSFRSPYSWLALYRINLIRNELPVEIQLTPVFPSRDKDDVMLSDQKKVKYVVKDVNRMASAYGLDMKWPEPFDTDWLAVHIAYIYAEEQGKGIPFCLALYHARFLEGKDVGDETIMREASLACDLDADTLIDVQGKREYKRKLLKGMVSAGNEGVFGVIGGMTDLNGYCARLTTISGWPFQTFQAIHLKDLIRFVGNRADVSLASADFGISKKINSGNNLTTL